MRARCLVIFDAKLFGLLSDTSFSSERYSSRTRSRTRVTAGGGANFQSPPNFNGALSSDNGRSRRPISFTRSKRLLKPSMLAACRSLLEDSQHRTT